MADDAAAAPDRLREDMIEAANAFLPGLDPERAFAAGALHACALKALAAVDAALKHHRRIPLYGNSATEEEPDACPHDPDDDRWHFEDPDGGEWLCQGKPEGVVCSCTESPDGERFPWPCDEVQDILAALTGEGKTDGEPE
jgi:hypothetical protein